MQKAEYLVHVCHAANPGIPSGILKTVTEACYGEDYDQDGIRRVHGIDDVGQQVTKRTNERNTALPKVEVDCVVENRRKSVSNERS